MANWQIIKKSGNMQDQFDDGLKANPGEPGFTTSIVEAYAGPKNYNYIGTPNWEAPVQTLPVENTSDSTGE